MELMRINATGYTTFLKLFITPLVWGTSHHRSMLRSAMFSGGKKEAGFSFWYQAGVESNVSWNTWLAVITWQWG